MSTILKPSIIEKLKPVRSVLLKVSIWTFVTGVMLSVMLILFGENNSNTLITYGRILGTVFIFAGSMLIAVNNFKRLESDKTAVSVLALIGLISNVIGSILWILLTWGVFSLIASSSRWSYLQFTLMGQLTYIITSIAMFSFFASNILLIGANKQLKNIQPLKITAIVCLAYEAAFCIFSVLTSYFDSKLILLASFAGFIWVISSVLAVIISVVSGSSEKIPPAPKSDDELRAEIEAKVRAEMIEKEVRARMEAEQNQSQPLPPTPPVV